MPMRNPNPFAIPALDALDLDLARRVHSHLVEGFLACRFFPQPDRGVLIANWVVADVAKWMGTDRVAAATLAAQVSRILGDAHWHLDVCHDGEKGTAFHFTYQSEGPHDETALES